MTNVQGLTIDSAHTRDLDDAIWLEQRADATTVWVSVANVATSVALRSRIDRIAEARGFTRYYAHDIRPMLPRALAEDRLSLLPGVPRSVICARITLDDNVHPIDVEFIEGTLTSSMRLTYKEAAELVASASNDTLHQMMRGLASLAKGLLGKRWMSGAAAIYDIEQSWAVTEDGNLTKLRREESNIGYAIVQELMLLANRVVAEHLARQNAPCLYRNHRARIAAPDASSLMQDIVAAFAHPDHFSLDTVRARLSLTLGRARYSPILEGHWSLKFPAYTHFTSPIRRYADLVNHRLLLALIRGEPLPYTNSDLQRLGDALNDLHVSEEQRRSARFKERAVRQAQNNLQKSPSTMTQLRGSEFYQMLKAATADEKHSGALCEVVKNRIAKGTLTLKEAFYLLFEYPSDATIELRRQILAWLINDPPSVVSLFAMAISLREWQSVRYSFEPREIGFTCHAELERDGRTYKVTSPVAAAKKRAQGIAAMILLHDLCNEPVPDELLKDEQPPAMNETAAIVAPTFDHRVQAAYKTIAPQLEAGNYLSALYELCTQLKTENPAFSGQQRGPAHNLEFECRVEISAENFRFEGEGRAGTKQEAKQRAAQALFNQMRTRFVSSDS